MIENIAYFQNKRKTMANDFQTQVIAYVVCFLVTNIDEFVILISFMLETLSNTGLTQKHVWLGTMIACTGIMALSLVGLASQAIPASYLVYVDILGIVPIIVGVTALYKTYYKEWWLGETEEEDETPQGETKPQPDAGTTTDTKQDPKVTVVVQSSTTENGAPQLTRLASTRLTRKMSSRLDVLHKINHNIDVKVEKATDTCPERVVLEFKVDEEGEQVDIEAAKKTVETPHKQKSCGQRFIAWLSTHRQIFTVVSLTLANSGDNVAVYLPMISSSSIEEIIVWVILFYGGMVGLLILARLMVNCQFIQDKLEKYGKFIIPWPLIGIGIYILVPFIVYLTSL